MGFSAIEINTNGLAISPAIRIFLQALKEAGASRHLPPVRRN